MADKLWFLRRLNLFEGMSEAELEEVSHELRMRSCPIRTTLSDGAGDRVYLNPSQTVRAGAATLIHEVNHVANRSQDHYANPRSVLEEEYRAYWVQRVWKSRRVPAAQELAELKVWIIDYGHAYMGCFERTHIIGTVPTHQSEQSRIIQR